MRSVSIQLTHCLMGEVDPLDRLLVDLNSPDDSMLNLYLGNSDGGDFNSGNTGDIFEQVGGFLLEHS